ncbi:uncharacterized protein (DUF885 family) [Terracoccus luteus]|uniref:Uncharacterized protein (DUF885 family) n=1 Tax=Terracoccus luteus TaxID=53356 RepID=A0A495Y1A6_9MICO|nr:DUF885 domain-containing protein [Terracoccus luteus]RKT78934.1 uncharacterized protein (DUF885 family) [Terracoccus luteus]
MTGPTPDHDRPAAPDVADVADRYIVALARTDVAAADLARREGIVVGDETSPVLPALSPDAFDDRSDAARAALAALAALPRRGDDDTLALVLRERLQAEVDLVDGGFTESLLAPLATPVDAVRATFDQLPTETDDDWRHVADALRRVGGAHDDYVDTLLRSAGRGHVVSRRQVSGVAARCRRWVDDGFYASLAGRAPAALRPVVTEAADAAARATSRLADDLEQRLLPLAGGSDAVGRERYELTARAFLGTTVDLDETYAWGWSELDRIAAEAEQVAAQVGPGGFASVAARLDSDPATRMDTGEQIERWLRERMAGVAETLDGRLLDLPPHPLRLPECRMSTAASGVMYYAEPDPGLTRPGRVWWTVDPAVGARTWREATTAHHEGVPGHHTQIVTAMTAPGLHPWQRHLCHVHGHAEGWAHWAEAWCAEVGLLDEPAERLGMLVGQAWRASRIVIDMGLHLGLPIPADRRHRTGLAAGAALGDATAWSYDVAVEFLTAVTGLGPQMARFEVDRYLGWPAQALAFRVGAREVESVRRLARHEAGGAWDERRFLTALLRLGPMGLGPLRELGSRLAREQAAG